MSPVALAIGAFAMFMMARDVGPEFGGPYMAGGYVLVFTAISTLVGSMTGGKL